MALGVVVYQLFYKVVPFEHMGRPYAPELRFSNARRSFRLC